MKFTIATLALIGTASANFVDTPFGGVYLMTDVQRESDYIANADKADDKEVEDEWDPEDDVVDDTGFVHKWLMTDSQVNVDARILNGLGNLIQLQTASPATGDSTYKNG